MRWSVGVLILVAFGLAAGAQSRQGSEEGVSVAPPRVPRPITRKAPAKVVVRMEARELIGSLADGVDYVFWTFDGHVPGSFVRVREGDTVEFHLSNRPDSRMPHNIDIHAVNGPGGGASASMVAPGQSTTFEFRALKPGLYVYHCATAPVGMHIANGMYGLILVEAASGLRRADREYYVMQGEFYTDGPFGEPGLRHFDMEKALAEQPDYVVFNGAVGALAGERALRARTGELVRLYVGNGGPSLTASFHVTGEVFDRVSLGGSAPMLENTQIVSLPPSGAAIVEFRVDVPGLYVLADHSIFRAFNKGALGHLRVQGPENVAVYKGRVAEDVYLLEGAAIQQMPVASDSLSTSLTLEDRLESGRRIFEQTCAACHQVDGRGIIGSFPPLAGSDFLNSNPRLAISIVLNGLSGEIIVNGEKYNAVMPALRLNDDDVADVLTYVYSEWGNSGHIVTQQDVSNVRHCPWCEDVSTSRDN